MKSIFALFVATAPLFAGVVACSSDSTDAQAAGIGAACSANTDCAETAPVCLPFKGGYCGKSGCKVDTDCPSGSACVTHTDGVNYCFATCADKPSCNTARSASDEANCSASITFADKATTATKACVPPSK